MSRAETTWTGVGATVRGAQHRREGLPNQDFISWWPRPSNAVSPEALSAGSGITGPALIVQGDFLAVALADGHGHPKGVRADSGARIAVGAALDVVCHSRSDLLSIDGAKSLQECLPARITAMWTERVAWDLGRRPLGEEELAKVAYLEGPTGRSALERHPEAAYGTTVILAIAAADHLLLAQLGDGDLLLVDSEGLVLRPIEKDLDLIANHTWSLASGDAAERFKTTLLREGSAVELVLAATDGYSNSYESTADFDKVATDILDTIREHGFEALQANLPTWLEATTEHGSGDDITVAVLARAPAMVR